MELKKFPDTIARSCMKQALEVLKILNSAIRDRLEWSYIDFPHSVLMFSDTETWQIHDRSD